MTYSWLIPAHAGKTVNADRERVAGQAHPRSRGENAARAITQMQAAWLIPAHAGKTLSFSFVEVRGAAHPRSRGENSPRNSPTPTNSGSSPLTRGKRG